MLDMLSQTGRPIDHHPGTDPQGIGANAPYPSNAQAIFTSALMPQNLELLRAQDIRTFMARHRQKRGL